jgi:hypothetical protein
VNAAFYTVLFGFFVTPATESYLLLGLGAIAVILTVFITSMAIRFRDLRKDAALIGDLQTDMR